MPQPETELSLAASAATNRNTDLEQLDTTAMCSPARKNDSCPSPGPEPGGEVARAGHSSQHAVVRWVAHGGGWEVDEKKSRIEPPEDRLRKLRNINELRDAHGSNTVSTP